MFLGFEELLEKVTDNNAFNVLMKSFVKRANSEQQCFPSLNTICIDTKLSLPTVLKATNWLIDNGFITKESRSRSNGGDTSSLYTIITQDIKSVRRVKLNKNNKEFSKNEVVTATKNVPQTQPENSPETNQVVSTDFIRGLNSPETLYSLNPQDNITKKIYIKKDFNLNSISYLSSNASYLPVQQILIDHITAQQAKGNTFKKYQIDQTITLLNQFDVTTQEKMIKRSINKGWFKIRTLDEFATPSKPTYPEIKIKLTMSQYPNESLESFTSRCVVRESLGDVYVNRIPSTSPKTNMVESNCNFDFQNLKAQLFKV